MVAAPVMDDRNLVTLPGRGADVAEPTVAMLYDLNLLPTKKDLDKAGEAGTFFRGPPQSVAIIESGATALSKWWATGGAALVVVAWGTVKTVWNNDQAIRAPLLWSAAIVTAAAVLGVSYLLASDVRGRAAAMVETITARRDIGRSFVDAATKAATGPGGPGQGCLTILPLGGLPAQNLKGTDTNDWKALAMEPSADADKIRYLLVKGTVKVWVDSADVKFV